MTHFPVSPEPGVLAAPVLPAGGVVARPRALLLVIEIHGAGTETHNEKLELIPKLKTLKLKSVSNTKEPNMK